MRLAFRSQHLAALCSIGLLSVFPTSVRAQIAAVGSAAFAGATPITFNGISDGTEVNGLSVGGILFSYSLGSGHVIINGGPGVTNHVAPQNIVSTGTPTGALSMLLSGQTNSIGFGYAILASGSVPNAVTITLFNGATNLGSLGYLGVPDPAFTGGFAGITSVEAFDRVELTFSTAGAAFAVDNIVLSAVPEPATVFLVGAGLLIVVGVARNRRVESIK